MRVVSQSLLLLAVATFANAFCPPLFKNQSACTCTETIEGIIVKCSGTKGPLVVEELKKSHHELRELTIENANILEIGPRAFKNLRIKKLNLDNNHIRKFHSEAFQGLEGVLVDLSINSNKLSEIPSKSLSKLRALTVLHMKCNTIGNLSDASFTGMSTLIDLDLSCNKICSISSDAFTSVRGSLQNLVLDNNCLNEFPGNALKNMDNLIAVHIKNNKLQEIGKHSIVNMPSLSLLTLSQNNISSIDKEAIVNSSNIHYIYLASNSLSGFAPEVMSQFRQAQVLDLSFNYFEKLEETTFTGMENLQHLNLDSNRLTEINRGSFEGMPLILLWLPNNCLTNISQTSFQGIPYLRQLSLTNNNIRDVQPLSFLHLANLHHLDLSLNKIVSLQPGAISGSDHLTVRLQENPMVCADDGFHVMNGHEAINLTTEPNNICKRNWREEEDQCDAITTRPAVAPCCGVEVAPSTPATTTTTTTTTTTEAPTTTTEAPKTTTEAEQESESEEEEEEEGSGEETAFVSTTTESSEEIETTTRKINMSRFMRLQKALPEARKPTVGKPRPGYLGFLKNEGLLERTESRKPVNKEPTPASQESDAEDDEEDDDSESEEIMATTPSTTVRPTRTLPSRVRERQRMFSNLPPWFAKSSFKKVNSTSTASISEDFSTDTQTVTVNMDRMPQA